MSALADFHFLRPEWLWALLPVALLLGLLWRRSRTGSGWSQVISAELLPHLMEQRLSRQQRLPLLALATAWLTATLALAGPSWEKIPQPVQRKQDALVILLDLSLSMLAQDIQPSRLVRSRQKLLDLLEQRGEGVTALVAWAGDAHVVSPLTDDVRTISNLLPALDPAIMPLPGSRPELAVEQALALLHSAGARDGQLLMIGDGLRDVDVATISSLMAATGFRLSVIGVGTSEGSPIPLPRGGYLKDRGGQIVVPGLERANLQVLALENGGVYSDLQLDDSDLQRVLLPALDPLAGSEWLDGRGVDTWHDMGFWLLLLALPVCLGAFRRGWILGLVLLAGLPVERSYAFEWQDLWLTPDQRGSQLLEQGDAEAAAQAFENPDWAGAAHYRAEDYEAAQEAFSSGASAQNWYNRGNALARAGQLDEALAAYQEALARDPDMEDASFNRDLLEQLKQQQQQQQSDQQDQQQSDQQDQQQQDQQGQQNQEQQGQQQQGQQDQQNQQQQDQQGQQSQEQQDQQQQGQQQAEQENSEQESQGQQTQQQNEQEAEREQQAQAAAEPQASDEEMERRQATEQWLRRIPDDPSGLLRRKFEYESRQREAENRKDNDVFW